MNIQLITGNKDFDVNDTITVSSYEHPMSPDDFDITIIDLSYPAIWCCRSYDIGPIEIYDDLRSISKMISDSTKSKIVYVYPQNIEYKNYYDGKKYVHHNMIKDLITNNYFNLGYDSCFSIYAPNLDVVFEPTKTKIDKMVYSADFRFAFDTGEVITKSEISGKTTTLKTRKDYYFTTLDICSSIEKLMVFINKYLINPFSEIPDWIKDYEFYNDSETKTLIETSKNQIVELTHKIETAESILSENNRYKSILFTNSDQLVEVVFEILEKILDCDLSEFIDVKKEDFRIEKDNVVFIGEIKGINTNVKNENISQLEIHYQSYLDEIADKLQPTNVHAILIINPLRNRRVEDRDPVSEQQINLARRNGSLIIETKTLLKVFELFLNDKLSSEECVEVFANKTGILKIEDFYNNV